MFKIQSRTPKTNPFRLRNRSMIRSQPHKVLRNSAICVHQLEGYLSFATSCAYSSGGLFGRGSPPQAKIFRNLGSCGGIPAFRRHHGNAGSAATGSPVLLLPKLLKSIQNPYFPVFSPKSAYFPVFSQRPPHPRGGYPLTVYKTKIPDFNLGFKKKQGNKAYGYCPLTIPVAALQAAFCSFLLRALRAARFAHGATSAQKKTAILYGSF